VGGDSSTWMMPILLPMLSSPSLRRLTGIWMVMGLLQVDALVRQIAMQGAIQAGQRDMIQRRPGPAANQVDPFHAHAGRRKLPARSHLAGQRRVAVGNKRQRNGILGELDAFQQQHRGKAPHPQNAFACARQIAQQRLAIFSLKRFSLRSPLRCGMDQIGFNSRLSAVGDNESAAQRIIVTPSALA
jgi:hypothetical protein